MQLPIGQIILFGSLAVILTFLSGVIPLLKIWKEDHLHTFVSLSAGVLIGTAFLHLMPDAIGKTSPLALGLCILGSFLFLFILEKFIMLHPCEETHCDYHTMGMAAFVGMLIHTFFDGFALGSSLFVSGLGWIVFIAIMTHKIPSSFALASILKKGNWSNQRILLFIFIFGLIIPVGALASVTLLRAIGEEAVGIALALSLGIFLYISTSDFLPEVHRAHDRRFKNLAAFLCGVALMAALAFLSPFHNS